MANYSSLSDLFTAIAGVIRDREGSTNSIVATDFPERIENLPSGGQSNGTFTLMFRAGVKVSYVDPTDGTVHVDTIPSSNELEIPIAPSSSSGFAVYGLSTTAHSLNGIIRGQTVSSTAGTAHYGVLVPDVESSASAGALYVSTTYLQDGDEIILNT